jgi:hypothetical protein
MDLVYLVRNGERNDELRHSLRSLVNLPHGRVWVVGHRPKWLTGVEHIRGNRYPSKELNVYDNLQLACQQVDADRFVVMNDDFFVMRPAQLRWWHRGTLTDHIAELNPGLSKWRTSLCNTLEWLTAQGFTDPLSYELHVPVVMERDKLADILARAVGKGVPAQWRTLYGNWWQVRSTRRADVRVRRVAAGVKAGTFLSTDDSTFRTHPAGLLVQTMFPEPCRYER